MKKINLYIYIVYSWLIFKYINFSFFKLYALKDTEDKCKVIVLLLVQFFIFIVNREIGS